MCFSNSIQSRPLPFYCCFKSHKEQIYCLFYTGFIFESCIFFHYFPRIHTSIILIELLYLVFSCHLIGHEHCRLFVFGPFMNFSVLELSFCVYIDPRYTSLECSSHLVMVRVSMKNYPNKITLKNYQD